MLCQLLLLTETQDEIDRTSVGSSHQRVVTLLSTIIFQKMAHAAGAFGAWPASQAEIHTLAVMAGKSTGGPDNRSLGYRTLICVPETHSGKGTQALWVGLRPLRSYFRQLGNGLIQIHTFPQAHNSGRSACRRYDVIPARQLSLESWLFLRD
jgi:hypothetical protein